MDAVALRRKSFIGLVQFQLALAVLLFLPAWSLRFWQAWLFWTLFGVAVTAISLWMLKYDPALVESRLVVGPLAEREPTQKIIQAAAAALFCALLAIPGFEHRLRPSAVPSVLVLVADAVVVAGLAIMFLAARENTFAASTIQVKAGQRVISTGPYAIVRHPMYSGGVLMFLAMPLALGSLWAIPCALLLCAVVAVRLLDEERVLSANLAGYDDYCARVKHHLIPWLW